APKTMLIPMFFLAARSLFPLFGTSLTDYHSAWIIHALETTTTYPALASAHIFIPVILTGGAVLAWFIGWQWYVKEKYTQSVDTPLVPFSYKRRYLDEFNERIFVKGTVGLRRVLYAFNRCVVDGITTIFASFVRPLGVVVYW